MTSYFLFFTKYFSFTVNPVKSFEIISFASVIWTNILKSTIRRDPCLLKKWARLMKGGISFLGLFRKAKSGEAKLNSY